MILQRVSRCSWKGSMLENRSMQRSSFAITMILGLSFPGAVSEMPPWPKTNGPEVSPERKKSSRSFNSCATGCLVSTARRTTGRLSQPATLTAATRSAIPSTGTAPTLTHETSTSASAWAGSMDSTASTSSTGQRRILGLRALQPEWLSKRHLRDRGRRRPVRRSVHRQPAHHGPDRESLLLQGCARAELSHLHTTRGQCLGSGVGLPGLDR